MDSFYNNKMDFGYHQRQEFPLSSCKMTLKNKELWKQFHNLETEMIITKSGRRMFPSLNIQITDLEPDTQYCVLLEMTPATPLCRYKYTASNGWSPAGPEEAQSPHRVYLHPDSPAPGRYWMAQSVSFGRVKLTNTANPPSGQLVLGSMHKYQPRVVVCHTGDVRGLHWAERTTVAFPETQFIAVTAYQRGKSILYKSQHRVYLHPDTPAPGRYWMAQSVSFGRVKLTNTANPPSGQLVLGSMHKYQPRVVVCHTGDVRGLHWAERTTVAFPETQFVAVTAYQNDRITKLKIDNNPFAKGFRENGQSKCKRKHYRKQEEEEIIDVTTPPPEAKKIKLDPLLSPESIKIEDDRISNVSSNSLSSSGISSSSPLTVRNYANSPIYSANVGYTSMPPYGYPYFYPYFMQQNPQSWRNGYFYQYSNNLSPNNYGAQDLTVNKVEKPKKLTDFSIKAITGLS